MGTVAGNLYCSMLTITVILLYRKLIPVQCLPWCDNLITLGCCQILIFFLFLKSKKISELYVHFEFQACSPWTKLAEIQRECCQNVRQQNRVCKFWLFFSLKSYAFFFTGSPVFFPFLTLSSCKIITNAWDTVFDVNVWRNGCHVNRFLWPKFSGHFPWFMASWSFVNIFTFSKHSKFLPF